MEFFKYIKENYKGYKFDAAYPMENAGAINLMENVGAELLDYDYEMKITRDGYKKTPEIYDIIELSEDYYKDFIIIHDKSWPDVYWTGKRLLSTLDKFDIFIALEEGEVVASVVISKFNKDFREIYLMAVAENKRYKNYEIALVNKALDKGFSSGAKEITKMLDKENTDELNLLIKLGFKKTDTCLTYRGKI